MKDHFEDFFSFFNLDSNIFASIYENTKQTEGIITNTIDWLDCLIVGVLRPTREYLTHLEVNTTCEGLHILTYSRLSRPLSSDNSIVATTGVCGKVCGG